MAHRNRNIRVIFDGLCSVCCLFKRFVEKRSGQFVFIPYQEIDFERNFTEIGLERSRRAVQALVDSGEVFEAGRAVGEILKKMSFFWRALGIFITLPVLIHITEYFYRLVADNRDTIASIFNLPPQKTICG